MQETAVQKQPFNKKEKNWILYDVANSAYVLLATALLSFYFDFLSPTKNLSSVWGNVSAIVAIISVLLCPVMGAIADFGKKKRFFIVFAGVGIVGCAVLSLFSLLAEYAITGILFLIVYIVTQTGHSSALVFYDSMLSDVTTDENMHRVSANGFAWGYIGSCIPFIICLGLYILGNLVFPHLLGLMFSLCCLVTAAWWFIFTIPLYKSYKQIHYLPKAEKPIRSAFKRLGLIFKEATKYKKVLFFLLAFFFYIDGVHTIISMAMPIGKDLFGFGSGMTGLVKLVLALFVTQIVAFPFSILFGKLASKYHCEKLLIVCISGYIGIGLLAIFLRQEWQFWLLAVGIGMFQGGIQAMSRSYFTKIIPADMSGEFFGLYDIFGKSAAILGTFLIGQLSKFFPLVESTWINLALLPLPTLFIVGLVLFLVSMKIPATKHDTQKEEE